MPTVEKLLGKIASIHYGVGGYQDVQLGLSITLEGNGWGTTVFNGIWDYSYIPSPTELHKWTEEDRTNNLIKVNRRISELLKQAKVPTIDKLKNIPIEATFECGTLKDWRILTEVL
jgi:hypothetical protein